MSSALEDKVDGLTELVDEMLDELPSNISNIRTILPEFGSLASAFQEYLKVASEFPVPMNFKTPKDMLWGDPVGAETDLPPVGFVPDGLVSFSVSEGSLYIKKGEAWVDSGLSV